MDASTASLSNEAAEQVESMRLDFEAHYRPVRGGHELEAVRLLSRTPGGLVGWSAASTGPYRPRGALPVACRGTAREVAAVLAFIACMYPWLGQPHPRRRARHSGRFARHSAPGAASLPTGPARPPARR